MSEWFLGRKEKSVSSAKIIKKLPLSLSRSKTTFAKVNTDYLLVVSINHDRRPLTEIAAAAKDVCQKYAVTD